MKEENLECVDIIKTQPGPVAKNATLGLPALLNRHYLHYMHINIYIYINMYI